MKRMGEVIECYFKNVSIPLPYVAIIMVQKEPKRFCRLCNIKSRMCDIKEVCFVGFQRMVKVKHIQYLILRIKATAVNSHYSFVLPNTRTSYSLFPPSDPKFPASASAFAGRFLTC